jgi:large subunit ribosomal protein L27e
MAAAPQKFLKPGKAVIVLNGRFAGKKAVILKNYDDGLGAKKFGCALVAGVERAPLRVTKNMTDKKIARRIRIKTFLKIVNYNHLMPTRYSLDVLDALKGVASPEVVADPAKKREARRQVKQAFEERHKAGQNKWFFAKLRF